MIYHQFIRKGQVATDCLVVDNIAKLYDGYRGVKNLSFGVHYGECFGLLGVNGAGKTTTFKIITGYENTSKGEIFGFGTSLGMNRRQFFSNIGYCPQEDPLIVCFTGKEMLELFAVLRGMSFLQARQEAMKWLRVVGLEKGMHQRCGQYSGGMKRRLCTAMACIGNPPLLVLDECTTGVDPVSRRQFHKVLEQLKDSGCSIILTSHSMDECETLCSRLGIMVSGQFQCFGGIQHLKSKFAKGYSVTFKLKSDLSADAGQLEMETQTFVSKINEQFQPCTLKDKHQNLLQYHLENPAISWDTLFKSLEGIKSEFANLIEDYTVNETTLEEVFLGFAKYQYKGPTSANGGCCTCCF